MGKSPIEVFNFFHDDSNILEKLEIKEIDSESIDLTVNLIKKKTIKNLNSRRLFNHNNNRTVEFSHTF